MPTTATREPVCHAVGQVRLDRDLALQGSYFYYRYKFDEGRRPLPEGIVDRQARQGVRVGLSVWLPLMR